MKPKTMEGKMKVCNVCGQSSFGVYLMKMGRKKISVNLCLDHLLNRTIKPFILGKIEKVVIPEKTIINTIQVNLDSPLWELVK